MCITTELTFLLTEYLTFLVVRVQCVRKYAEFIVAGFLSPTLKERLEHWAHGIKDTKAHTTEVGAGVHIQQWDLGHI